MAPLPMTPINYQLNVLIPVLAGTFVCKAKHNFSAFFIAVCCQFD